MERPSRQGQKENNCGGRGSLMVGGAAAVVQSLTWRYQDSVVGAGDTLPCPPEELSPQVDLTVGHSACQSVHLGAWGAPSEWPWYASCYLK